MQGVPGRVAVCLFGLVGSMDGKNGVGKQLDPRTSAESIRKAFSLYGEVDYYIHTWSVECRDELIDLYQPEKICVESKPKIDDQDWCGIARKSIRSRIKSLMGITSISSEAENLYRAHCRWTSTGRAIGLIPVEQLNGYDYVLSCRLDLEFFEYFCFPQGLNEREILVSHWNEARLENVRTSTDQNNLSLKKSGFLDLWFGGRPNMMRDFGKLIDNFFIYRKNPHLASWDHCKAIGARPRYYLYRGLDYELVRRWRYNSAV